MPRSTGESGETFAWRTAFQIYPHRVTILLTVNLVVIKTWEVAFCVAFSSVASAVDTWTRETHDFQNWDTWVPNYFLHIFLDFSGIKYWKPKKSDVFSGWWSIFWDSNTGKPSSQEFWETLGVCVCVWVGVCVWMWLGVFNRACRWVYVSNCCMTHAPKLEKVGEKEINFLYYYVDWLVGCWSWKAGLVASSSVVSWEKKQSFAKFCCSCWYHIFSHQCTAHVLKGIFCSVHPKS